MTYAPHSDAAFEIWDRLSELGTADTEAALCELLQRLVSLCRADHGFWVGSARLEHLAGNGPAGAWRSRKVYCPDSRPETEAGLARALQPGDSQDVTAALTALFEGAGEVRVTRWDSSPQAYDTGGGTGNGPGGNHDALIISTPIGDYTESHIVLERCRPPAFGSRECQIATHVMRGLKWFQRRVILSFGVQLTESSLSPVERRIVHALLTDKTEAQIAADLGQTGNTTHSYITGLYRKLDVNSRASLAALWLGDPVHKIS